METEIFEGVAGFLLIVIVCVVWRLVKLKSRKREDDLKQIVTELGLSYQVVERKWGNGLNQYFSGSLSSWEISGVFNGCEVKIFEKTLDTGEDQSDYVHFEVLFPRKLPFDLLIRRKRFKDRLGLFFHLQKAVLIGEVGFDSRFIVKSDAVSNVIGFLNFLEKRAAIEKLFERNENIRIENSCIYFSSSSIKSELQEYRRVLETMTDTAKVLAKGF